MPMVFFPCRLGAFASTNVPSLALFLARGKGVCGVFSYEIAETKMPDLNANDIEAAMKVVEGTARSMGIVVEG